MATNVSNFRAEVNWVYWLVAIILLIWAIFGACMYIIEMTWDDAAYTDMFGEESAQIRPLVPAWSIAGYAIGVWSGLAGTIALLLRKGWAVPAFAISLLGAIIGWSWWVIDDRAKAVINDMGGWYMMGIIFAICIFSLWWSRRKRVQGLLG